VEAYPIDKNIYGTIPSVARYGPIILDQDMKSTIELLLTSGGTKFSLYIYDTVEQEKVTNKEIIIYISSNELKLVETDYNGKEKVLEAVKYHQMNPIMKPHPYDSYRFTLKFFEYEVGNTGVYNMDKLKQVTKAEYHLIAMSKQCREIIYLLMQCFLLDEKIKNNKLFTCMNYNVLPQETKVGITDLISEIKTLREENTTILNNMKIMERANRDLKREMKSLEEDFQISLESINQHISGISSTNTPTGTDSTPNRNINNYTSNSASQNAEMRKKYDELLSNNSLVISKEKALREENKELTLNVVITKNKCDELEIDNKKLNNHVVNLELEIKSLKKSLSILTETFNKSKTDIESLGEQRDILLRERDELVKKLKNINDDGKLELNSKITELQKQVDNLTYDNKNLIIQRNVLTNQKDILSKEVEKLSRDKQATEEKMAKAQEDKEAHLLKSKENETMITNLNNNIELKRKEIAELKLKYELLEVEYSTIKNNFDNMFLNNSEERSGNHVKITQDEYDEYDQLKREKDESEAILMQLKSNNDAKDLEIKSLKKKLENFQQK
jgi:chromosome segregation ATPase